MYVLVFPLEINQIIAEICRTYLVYFFRYDSRDTTDVRIDVNEWKWNIFCDSCFISFINYVLCKYLKVVISIAYGVEA